MKRKIISITAALLATTMLLTGCGVETEQPIAEEDIEFVQFETPKEGSPVATIDTTMGTIEVVLFPDEAPKAVENFLTLAKQGYYDGTCVFSIMSEGAFLAGSADTKGDQATSIYNGKDFDYELSPSLWSYSGAVGAISKKNKKASSRFFIVGEQPVAQEILDKMQEAGYPQKVIDKFAEVGGAPIYSRQFTIFGQVIQGLDVANQIMKVAVTDKKVPVEDIKINKITVSEYHAQ